MSEKPPPGAEAWRADIERVLKGRPVASLNTTTPDGVVIEPLYARREGPRAFRRRTGGWRTVQRIDHASPADAVDQIDEEARGGADAVQLVFAGAAGAPIAGLAPVAMEGLLTATPRGLGVVLDLPPQGEAIAELAARLRAPKGVDAAQLELSFGLGPFGHPGEGARWSTEAARLATLVIDLSARGFAGPFVVADARRPHNAGATAAQELGFAIAAAIVLVRGLSEQGLDRAAACAAVEFRLAVDQDQLASIAKLRALRILWARAQEALEVPPRAAHVLAETSWRMLSALEPDVNVLRSSVAAFSAGVGGADDIAILPHTAPATSPDAFARRLARNASLLMARESLLGFVDDPAAGAGAFEALTEALCRKGWEELQRIEREGGAGRALSAGSPFADRVAASAQSLKVAARTRLAPLTGVSLHAYLDGELEVRPSDGADGAFAPIRLSEPFEALRAESDRLLSLHGARPHVMLATLGPREEHAPRVEFARELLGGGGFETRVVAADAALASRPLDLVCLCGADAAYRDHAAVLARSLKSAGARSCLLAGKPREAEAEWRAAGIDDFIYAGVDAIAASARLYAKLGAAREGRG